MAIKCPERPIREEQLDSQLTAVLKDFIMPESWAEQLNAMAEKESKEAVNTTAAVSQNLRERIQGIDRKLERLFQGYVSELLEPEQYRQEKNKCTSEKKTLNEQIARLEQRQTIWIEPLKQWIKDARNLGEITLSPELHPKKSAAQKIFGLNLFLKNQKIEFVPQMQWAALCATRQNVSKLSESLILVPGEGLEPSIPCGRQILSL